MVDGIRYHAESPDWRRGLLWREVSRRLKFARKTEVNVRRVGTGKPGPRDQDRRPRPVSPQGRDMQGSRWSPAGPPPGRGCPARPAAARRAPSSPANSRSRPWRPKPPHLCQTPCRGRQRPQPQRRRRHRLQSQPTRTSTQPCGRSCNAVRAQAFKREYDPELESSTAIADA